MGRTHDFYCCGSLYSPFDMPVCCCCGGQGVYDPDGLVFDMHEEALRRGDAALAARINRLVYGGRQEQLAELVDQAVGA